MHETVLLKIPPCGTCSWRQIRSMIMFTENTTQRSLSTGYSSYLWRKATEIPLCKDFQSLPLLKGPFTSNQVLDKFSTNHDLSSPNQHMTKVLQWRAVVLLMEFVLLLISHHMKAHRSFFPFGRFFQSQCPLLLDRI